MQKLLSLSAKKFFGSPLVYLMALFQIFSFVLKRMVLSGNLRIILNLQPLIKFVYYQNVHFPYCPQAYLTWMLCGIFRSQGCLLFHSHSRGRQSSSCFYGYGNTISLHAYLMVCDLPPGFLLKSESRSMPRLRSIGRPYIYGTY